MDVENMIKIFCGNCGIKLDDKDTSCPNCGSAKQELMITLKDTINITLHSKLGTKVKKRR
uniref:Zinc-ribbon domain-containing protein n=1 Tax=Methanococcus maripaludis (strain C6 / ATCC BAA-1332) TaxID=444158 RepID=A9A8F2_METM6